MKLTKTQLENLIRRELSIIMEGLYGDFSIDPAEFIARVGPLIPYLSELSSRDINTGWPDSERNWSKDISTVRSALQSMVMELKGVKP